MNDSVTQTDFIDVRQRIGELSIEELNRTAEEFFARRADWDSLLAKPFSEISESPDLLISFAHVVRGLELLPDMTILDFGAGTCWTSRFLAQMGLRVIALDVSQSALNIGRKMLRRHPLIGARPRPRFLLFDGRRIDLPDDSVDRISCWEALHHVPNPNDVLREMARVLKPGGLAGFSEPGPAHSKSEQSQLEMKTHGVIENDVDVHEIWRSAEKAGFTGITLIVFNTEPITLSLDEFENFLNDREPEAHVDAQLRAQLQERRLFFLRKGERTDPLDSRQRVGLSADIKVSANTSKLKAGQSVRLRVEVRNTGSAVWLPTPEARAVWWKKGPFARVGRREHMGPDRIPPRVGGVRLGIQLFSDEGALLDIDYFRYHLTPGAGREVLPGETIERIFDLPMVRRGKYILHCDLVSEGVSWFAANRSAPVEMPVEVW
jgi:SAM-dependent methyltransferase